MTETLSDVEIALLAAEVTVRAALADGAPPDKIAAILITAGVGVMKTAAGAEMARIWTERAFERAMTACFCSDAELARDLAAADGGVVH